MSETLRDWQANRWLRPHGPTREEMANLLAIAERDLDDSRKKVISPDW
jgi:hypothetical protein